MNTNEYIDKYSQVEINKQDGTVTVTMEVPPRYVAELKYQECEESKVKRVHLGDVVAYLGATKKIKILSVKKSDSIHNAHPRGLTGTWIFSIEKVTTKKKKQKTSETLPQKS